MRSCCVAAVPLTCIVHALGHKVCDHRVPAELDVDGWNEFACGRRGSGEEREADVFATEHLTPEPWTRPYCTVSRVDLDAIHTITTVFPVSPVMAAMRFVELTHHACAVVYVERGPVKWFKGSRSFPGGRIPRPEPRRHRPRMLRRFCDQGTISTSCATWMHAHGFIEPARGQ